MLSFVLVIMLAGAKFWSFYCKTCRDLSTLLCIGGNRLIRGLVNSRTRLINGVFQSRPRVDQSATS